MLAISAAAAALVVGAGAVAAVLLGRPDAGAGPPPGAAPGPAPAPASAPATAPAAGPTPAAPAEAVALAAGVGGAGAEDARRVLAAYVSAINEERYEDAFALFSPDSATAAGGLPAWLDAQQPRVVDDARLVAVRPAGGGDLAAVLVFRSRQDPSFSPDGAQDCLDWELTYDLAGPGPGYLIRSGSPVTDPRPC
nr:hypothetical protein [uncultured bacterium]